MTSQPKVLWLTPDKPDNISVGRQRLASHLGNRGFNVVLRGTTVQTTIESLLEAGEYDVIVGTTRAGALAGAFISLVTRTPFVVDHVDPISQFEETNPKLAAVVRIAEAFAFRLSDFTLFVYDEERDRVARHAGRSAQTDLGVEYQRFANPAPETVERAGERLLEEGVDGRTAIYVGGLEPIYRIETMLEAFEYLEGWTLVILGDGSLSAKVRHAAAAVENVVFLGSVPHKDVPGYLQHADLGISLVDDQHTLKVLEYAAAGLSIVQLRGSADERLGGLAEFCESDPEDVARAVSEAAADTDELRAFAKEYGWDRIAGEYEDAILTALDSSPA